MSMPMDQSTNGKTNGHFHADNFTNGLDSLNDLNGLNDRVDNRMDNVTDNPLTNTPAYSITSHMSHRSDYAPFDVLVRNRDREGNRLPWRYAPNLPLVDEVVLEDTPLKAFVERLADTQPMLATALHHFYNHKLITALRRYLSVRQEEEQWLASHNQRLQSKNEEIEAEQARLNAEQESALQAYQEALAALEEPLAQAHEQATHKVTQAGGIYDPQAPSETCVLRHAPKALEVVAAELQLPWTPADEKALLPALWSWLTTTLIGLMIGLSIGMMAGLLQADNLFAKPFVAGFCALVGFAAALLGKSFVKLSQREASQRYWLGLKWTSWLPFALLALLVDGTLILIDSYVEQEGLLASLHLKESVMALSGTTESLSEGKHAVYFLAAILLTFGYVGTSAWEGYLCGRREACLHRLQQKQADDFAQEDIAIRQRPEVQDALLAIAQVKAVLRQQEALCTKRTVAEAHVTQQLAHLEAQRQPLLECLPPEAKMRLQDALDDFHGAQADFDQLLDEALLTTEGASYCRGWLQSFSPPKRGHAPKKRLGQQVKDFFGRLFGKRLKRSAR